MSASLKKCNNPACEPVEQIRGNMGAGDYFGVISDGRISKQPVGSPAIDLHEFAEITDDNRNDIRVACGTCYLQIPWVPGSNRDIPGSTGKSLMHDFCLKQWDEAVEGKVQKEDMLAELEKQFGKDALIKHFGKSL